LFEEKLIKPSYCVLPFVSDIEIKKHMNLQEEKTSFDKEDINRMIIDENSLITSNSTTSIISRLNNNNVILPKHQQEINLIEKSNQNLPDENYLVMKTSTFENSISNHPFTFSLSAYLQKKKEMSAILVPRYQQNLVLNQNSDNVSQSLITIKSPMLLMKSDTYSGKNKNQSAVSEHENQIQTDMWPINCIKCKVLLQNLDSFNVHMNDHWSDDKSCPVCGLLINSKRFNFKQHLKIHTGEKPFVCQVCSRAFRQKAHMVKHVTTHKTDLKKENSLVCNDY
jgi:hypothetical protein